MFRRVSRLCGIALIICAILITQIPAKEAYASYAKEDFLMDNDILTKYTGTATTVSVSDDVRFIGEEAFAGNPYIGTINLGKNLKGIRGGAFANCAYLNKVIIPDSVTYIDSSAFSGCTSMQNISLGKNVEEIGDAVFAGCKELISVGIPKANENFKFENGTLYDNKQEKIYAYLCGNPYDTYKMPNTVKHISQYSFWGNEDLAEVYLSSNLDSIPGYAFSNCKNLSYIQIPYSVDSIDAKAFENCISLKDVEIPASVQYIAPTAFDGCINLNIIASEGTVAYEFFKNFDRSDIASSEVQDAKAVVKPNGNYVGTANQSGSSYVSNINSDNGVSDGIIDASKDPSNIEWMPSVDSLSGPEDSSVLGKTIVVSGRAVFFINREMEVNQLDANNIGNNGAAVSKEGSDNDESVTDIDNASNDNQNSSDNNVAIYDSGKGGFLPKYTEVDGKIASLAYYAAQDMDDYVIPSKITDIGEFSFARSNISSVDIPEGVKSIGYGAFYHCDNLNNVVIPSTVENIDAYAFNNTPYMNQFKSNVGSDEFLVVGDGLLLAYNGIGRSVNIPSGVKKICAAVFMDNKDIEAVYIPDSVESIESDAFRNCKSLNVIEGGNGIEYIGDRAFMGCPVGTFTVGENVNKMGLRAVDFSDTNKTDSSKVVVFEGNEIPGISADATSRRLNNKDYRENVLYNCLYAVVDDSVDSLKDTVLDGSRLGFSGLVVSLEKDSNGDYTGFADVKANYIFSDEVMKSIPSTFAVKGVNYIIKDFDKLQANSDLRKDYEGKREVAVLYNDDHNEAYTARFSEKEDVGVLKINESESAKNTLLKAYNELFGNEIDLKAYDIRLWDNTGSIKIDKFGKSVLYITVPVDSGYSKYHVVTLDSDGQLEELNAVYNDDNKNITFETNHLSYVGIYGINDENVTLNMKDGKLVRNYRLDKSPDTGDSSIPIKYVAAICLLAMGVLLILIKPRKIHRR